VGQGKDEAHALILFHEPEEKEITIENNEKDAHLSQKGGRPGCHRRKKHVVLPMCRVP